MQLSDFRATVQDLLEEFGPDAFVTFYPDGITFGGTKHDVAIDYDDLEDTADEWSVFTFYDVDNGSPLTLERLYNRVSEAEFESVDGTLALYFVDYDGNPLNRGSGSPDGLRISIGTPEQVEEFYL